MNIIAHNTLAIMVKKAQIITPQINSNHSWLLNTEMEGVYRKLAKNQAFENIKIVFFGTPDLSAYILERLIEFSYNPPQSLAVHPGGIQPRSVKFEVKSVVTSSDKPVGRRKLLTQTAVSKVAQKYHIPTLKPEKLDEEFLTSHLSLLTSDLFIVVAYGQILPKQILEIPSLGSINVHGSILPKYRGASPIQTAILNGDKETGISLMLMDEEMDHGPVLSAKRVSLSDKDTYLSLSNKLSQVGADLLIEILPDFIRGNIKPKGQRHAIATYCTQITKQDGYIEIDNPPPAEKLDRMIRAYYPWPGVWTKWSPSAKASRDKKGKIVKFLPNQMVQMEGKKAVPLKDFLNGYHDFPLKNLI